MKKSLVKLLTYRLINLYAFIFTCAILVFAGYAQMHYNLEPCPLCVMQRVIFAVLGLLFLVCFLYVASKRTRQVFHGIILIISLFGVAIACRHIYLQHLPPDLAPSCGPGLNFIVKNFPPGEVLRMMLMGTGECAKVDWYFLGLTIPEWSLICFIFLGGVDIFQFSRKKVR